MKWIILNIPIRRYIASLLDREQYGCIDIPALLEFICQNYKSHCDDDWIQIVVSAAIDSISSVGDDEIATEKLHNQIWALVTQVYKKLDELKIHSADFSCIFYSGDVYVFSIQKFHHL